MVGVKGMKWGKTKSQAKKVRAKGKGQGWHGEPKRHMMSRYGYKTVLPDGRRLHMGNFVAGGEPDIEYIDRAEYIIKKEMDEGNVIIWDNGGETADRYTILIDRRYVFGMSEQPFHPQGFNQFSGDVEHWARERNTPYRNINEFIEMNDKKDIRLSHTQINDMVKKAIVLRTMEDE